MEESDIKKTIELLRDDNNYYGEIGKQFLSASDIKTLVSTPDQYGVSLDEDTNLLKGTYLHRRLLQPELLDNMIIVDATTRTTKVYKEIVAEHTLEGLPKPIFLLKKETEELELLAMKAESNHEFVDALQSNMQPFEVEEPMIGEVMGYWFKAKADRKNQHRGFIADIKTARSLSSFVSQFRAFGYHGTAYVYSKLFGMPVRFYVISKEDGRLGVYDVSEETLAAGEEYVRWGLEKLEMYYGSNPTESIEQYYEYKIV